MGFNGYGNLLCQGAAAMKWQSEPPPAVQSSKETRLEWLIRSFRRISDWTLSHVVTEENPHPQYLKQGYGGILRSTPTTGLGALSTTPTFIGPTAYDSVLSDAPVDVQQLLTNGTLVIDSTGTWGISWGITAEIVPITANASNTIALATYNVTDSVLGDRPSYFTIPRYGEAIGMGPNFVPIKVDDTLVGKEFGLAIWILNASPAVTITDLISLDFHAIRVGNGT